MRVEAVLLYPLFLFLQHHAKISNIYNKINQSSIEVVLKILI